MAKREKICKECIVKEAISEFAKNGFILTTTDNIVAAAGISVGSLYKHFKSKVKLFEECIKFIYSDILEMKKEILSIDVESETERMALFLYGYFKMFSERKDYAKLMLIEFDNFCLAHPDSEIVNIKEEEHADFVEELESNPFNKEIDSRIFSSLILGGIE